MLLSAIELMWTHACHHRLVGARDDIAKTDKLIDQRFILADEVCCVSARLIFFQRVIHASTFSAKTTSASRLVVVIVLSSDMVRK